MNAEPALMTLDGEILSTAAFSSQFVNREWSVFIGSGLPAAIYKDWRDLVTELCVECTGRNPLPDSPTTLELQTAAQDALDSKPERFRQIILQRFSPGPQAAVAPGYLHLLGMNFASLFTTNYDHGLVILNQSDTCKKQPRHVFIYPELKTTAVALGGIFYLHGKPTGPSFDCSLLVLTKSSFDKAYSDIRLTHLLTSMWIEVNLIIIGARLDEPELRNLLEHAEHLCSQWHKQDGVGRPRRIIILPRYPDGAIPSIEVYRERLGLEVLTYQTTLSGGDIDHSELHRFLEQVAKLSPPRGSRTIPDFSPEGGTIPLFDG